MMTKVVRCAPAAFAAALSACTAVGPEIVRFGRPAYNDAILETNDEQLLQNIVRLRFGDSLGFLTVSSVTANVSVTTTGTVNLGFGSPVLLLAEKLRHIQASGAVGLRVEKLQDGYQPGRIQPQRG